jgi:hypothetical protein
MTSSAESDQRIPELTSTAPPAEASVGDGPAARHTRRGFLGSSARKLVYAAPVVLLFHPRQACASGGSQITQA